MDRQELIVLFVVAIIAVLALILMYNNVKTTGDTAYPQFDAEPGASCYTNGDCYWQYNSLNYECRAGICKPKAALGPPAYTPKLKTR